jgi:hypothetical protein
MKMTSSKMPKENPFKKGKGTAKMNMLKNMKAADGKVDADGKKIKKMPKK